MAEDFSKVQKLIFRYIREVQEQGITIERAILYGSYARGNATEFSDIDFALISKDFCGIRFDDRCRVVPLRRKIDERLEPMPFLPEDFHAGNPLAADIMEHGIEIELEEVRLLHEAQK
ncbi:MAG: nucleotidyltransferase domain-containing protein [bacterium]